MDGGLECRDINFTSAVSYSLSCLKKEGLKLKPEQLEAIRLVYSGKYVFVWLLTGYGKSICYQTLPHLFDYKMKRLGNQLTRRSVVLVVSPLVSLMVDQVSSFRRAGINSAAILSGNTGVDDKLTASGRDIQEGKFNLLYSAPEAIVGVNRWRQMLSFI